MRGRVPGLLLLLAFIAGCGRHDAGTDATNAALPAPDASSATEDAIRSPVPAFHGGGAGWKLDLRVDVGLRHTGRLWRGGRAANATLVLRARTPAADPDRFTFDGTVFAANGDTPLQVVIRRADCRDADGKLRMQTVEVVVRGAPALLGCGEITPY